MSTPSDEQLAARSIAGDLEAVEALARRFLRPVYAVCLRIIRDRALAEDASQDALVSAFRGLATFQPDRRFSAWILTIAARVSLNALRGRHRRRLHEANAAPTLPEVDASAALESREAAEGLTAAIERLPDRDAAALYMRFRENLSFEEIAEALELQSGAVRVLLCRALARLHKELEPIP